MGEQEFLTDILWHFSIRLGGKWQRDDWVYERLGQYRQEAYRAGQEEMRERIAVLQDEMDGEQWDSVDIRALPVHDGQKVSTLNCADCGHLKYECICGFFRRQKGIDDVEGGE